MNGFKRLCLFIFSLAGMLVLASLVLPWVGPWQRQAAGLITGNRTYFFVLEVLVCLVACGFVIMLFRSLFSRANKKIILVTSVDGGRITVSRDAIASQAAHIIEEDGTCTAVKVDVDARRRRNIKVYARVLPGTSVDVISKGNELHSRLATGLAAVCGDSISSISIEFEEPEEVTTAVAPAPAPASALDTAPEGAYPAASYTPDQPVSEPTSEITLDMATFHSSDAPQAESEANREE